MSGCENHCPGCHNPQTWDERGGTLFDDKAKEKLFRILAKPYIFGLTLSGGDPLYKKNLSEIKQLVYEVKKIYPAKTIWIYTGYKFDDIFKLEDNKKRREIVKRCDVIVDGKYVKELRDTSYPWAGSINQRVIDIQKSLTSREVVLYKTENY